MKRTIVLLTVFAFAITQIAAQNTGIGTSVPTGKLDINGDLILRSRSINLTSAVTSDLDVNTSKYNHYRLTGPAGNFVISGIRAGVQDRMVTLYNRSGNSMQLYNEDPVNPTPANRIITGTNANLDIYNGGSVTLKYDVTLARWEVVGSHASSLNYYGATWGLYGNSGNNLNAFIGTTDAQPLRFGVNNGNAGIIDSANANTALGSGTLRNLTNGGYNVSNVAMGQSALQNAQISSGTVAIGFESMKNFTGQNFPAGTLGAYHNTAIGFQTLYSNDGISNTAVGGSALRNNTTGSSNTALGDWSLLNHKSGDANVALGDQALYSDTSGTFNTAIGSHSMQNNLSGQYNTATGFVALAGNTQGSYNTANGSFALGFNKGSQNTAIGLYSMFSNGTGNNNTAVGANSMQLNTTGSSNIAIGVDALLNNTTRSNLVAIGDSALFNNGVGASTTDHGTNNTAVGSKSLYQNTTGYYNTATGTASLKNNTTGVGNTAMGAQVLNSNTIGNNNTGMGYQALYSNTIGDNNAAYGVNALYSNVGGTYNTAMGLSTLFSNSSGSSNTAIGFQALASNAIGGDNTGIGNFVLDNSTGSYNTANGSAALVTLSAGNNNTAMGYNSLGGVGFINTSNRNSALGANAGSTVINSSYNTFLGSYSGVSSAPIFNAVAIGDGVIVNASNKIRLGDGGITVIEGQVAFSSPSDARFKSDIKENVPGLDFIKQLKPVTYRFNTKKFQEHLMQDMPDSSQQKLMSGKDYTASSNIIHTGFLAQDIEIVCKKLGYTFDGLHTPDPNNKTDNYSVAYSQFIMPLVKGMQEQQTQIEALQKQNIDLLKRLEKLEAK